MATQAAPPESKAVARTQGGGLKAWLNSDQFRSAVATSLPKHLTADRFCRIAITAMLKTPALAKCTQESVFDCLLTLSALGLEPDGRRAHLIPFGNKCTLIIDYKGIAELVMRSGLVSNIHADVVCENDDFEYDRGEVVRHKIDFRKPRGAVYAVYCRITFKDGSSKCEALSREDVEGVRKRSRAGNDGPWKTDWNEMAKKTAARRVFKWVPWSPEERDLVEKDDIQFEGPRREPERGSVSLVDFTPSDDPNRGHDGASDEEFGPDPKAGITRDEITELIKAANAHGKSSEFVEIVAAHHGFKRLTEITNEAYPTILAELKKGDAAE